ncbi:MAG: beta strand repeat-containing protein [Gammaproteobacteria bacterium]
MIRPKTTIERLKKIARAIVFLGAIVIMGTAFANPQGGVVSSGSATIQQTPGNTVIQQNSQQAIINWQSFNIGSSETTHFQQPTGGVALNRINPQQGASQIFGQLTSTGQIILINQAGIYFGPTAHVDVGSIIASTSDMSDANFLAGKYIFDQPSPYNGSIINEGTIRAANYGLVALVGTGVRNDGTIQANLGNVVLASGSKFTIDMTGDGLVNFTVDQGSTTQGVDQNGAALKDGVANTGSVIADGGKILMTAQAAQGVLDNVINMSGVAQAHSVAQKNGVIILQGDNEGTVTVSGKLDASGKTTGSSGGTVKVLGNLVHVLSPAVIDVSGDVGGGTVLLGGNFRGAGPEQNALATYVGNGTVINANAITQGNGGNIAIWSSNATQVYGSITAEGGALGGNGGYLETSGHYLDINGAQVNLSAPHGQSGQWLLDPYAVDICDATTSPSCTSSSPSYVNPYDATGASLIYSTDITNNLQSGTNVTIDSTGGGGGDINLLASLSWGGGGGKLTLNSGNNINFDNNIFASGSGSLDVTAVGTIFFNNSPTIFPSGGVVFHSPVVLTSDTTIGIGGGSVGLIFTGNATINGAYNLDLVNESNSSSAPTELGASVGTTTALASLTIAASQPPGPFTPTTEIDLGVPSGGSGNLTIKTTGDQTYAGYVLLNVASLNDYIKLDAGSGNISFASTNIAGAPNNISVDSASNVFAPAILNISTTGNVSFTGSVGTSSRVGLFGLNITSGSTTFHSDNQSITDPGGYQVYTLGGGQTYSGPITLNGSSNISMQDSGAYGTSPIIFNSSVDGAVDLSVTASNGVTINNNFGVNTPLKSLYILGPFTLSPSTAISIDTVNNQEFVNLVDITGGANVTFSSSNSGNFFFDNVGSGPLAGSIMGEGAEVAMNTTGTVTLHGDIGTLLQPLGSVFITSSLPLQLFGSNMYATNINLPSVVFHANTTTLGVGTTATGNTPAITVGDITGNGGVQTLDFTANGNANTNISFFIASIGAGSTINVTGGSPSDTLGVLTLGSQSLTADAVWSIISAGSGTVSGFSNGNSVSFTNFANLVGQNHSDTFNFPASSSILEQSVTSESAASATLDLSNAITAANVVLNGVTIGSFSGVKGTSNVDVANFSGMTIINGPTASASSNTLTSNPGNFSFWFLNNGANAGSIQAYNINNNIGNVTFNSFGNLVGGLPNNDDFIVSPGASFTSVNGNTDGAALDLSAFSSAGTINFSAAGVGGLSGTYSGISFPFENIYYVYSPSATTSITSSSASATTFQIVDNATVTTSIGSVSAQIVSLPNINIIGSSAGPSTFMFAAGTTGTLTGGSGGINTLVGAATANTWNITGDGIGNVGSITFSNIQSFVGGSSGDTYDFNAGINFGEAISAGAGTNTFNFGDNDTYSGTLTGGSDTNNFNFGANDTYSGTLTGGNGTNTFNFGTNGTYSGTLTGGSGTNNYNFSANYSGTLTGGSGTNNFNFAANNTYSVGLTGGSGANNFNFGANDTYSGTLTGGSGANNFNFGANGTYSGTLTGGSSANNFNFGANGSYSGTLTGGSGANNFNFSANSANSGTINGGNGASAVNNFVFGDKSQFTGTLNGGTSAQSNQLIFSSYTTPITLTFSSISSGAVTNNASTNIANFSNFMSSTGPGSGSIVLPAGLKNTLTINSNGNGSFNDPFNFNNTNNGFTTYTAGNSGDTVVFNGFSPTITKISASEFSAHINGTTYFFFGFPDSPSPSPSPTPTPPVPPDVTTDNGIVITATYTGTGSSSDGSIGVLTPGNWYYIKNPVYNSIEQIIQDQLTLDTMTFVIKPNC